MSAGTRVDHDRFCVNEGWELGRDARGRAVRHHVTYELGLRDGNRLRTRISRPVDKTTYGPNLWKTILRDQLDVTETAFWVCVRDKQLPDRGRAESEVPPNALPAGLVHQLITHAGLAEHEVAAMTISEATAAMTRYWSRPRSD